MATTPSPTVAAELVALLHRHLPAVLAANLINSTLVVFALWPLADRRTLLGWVAMTAVLTLARVLHWRDFRRDSAAWDLSQWARLYTAGAALSGVLWGSTAFLFIDPGHPISLILISFVIGGMGAGAVTGLSAHMIAFDLYLLGSVLPLVLRLSTMGDRVSLAMAAMASIYFVGLAVIGRNFNNALVRSLRLNEENQRLLAAREQEIELRTATLRATNRELEREILERKAAQSRMEEARAEAERANRAKSQLVAAVSHDLRQPLQSVVLYAASLRYYIQDDKGCEILKRIARNLDILKSMLDGLLDLSRLDVDTVKPNRTVFPLRPVLDDIVATYAGIAAAKGLRVEIGSLADVSVRSDEILLGRIIRNLMENAVRYTERGHILLSSRAEGDWVQIEVTDTGIGIPEDQVERVFEEFYQVGNAEGDKGRGLGLGLAIVQRLSILLHHPIEVRSRVGVGSTFTIRLPAVAGAPALSAAISGGEPPAIGYGNRVTIIDDDAQVRLALGGIFARWRFDITMVASMDEALDSLDPKAVPDLIVVEYRPRAEKTGMEAIRTIRAACATRIPSILITSETDRDWLTEAESLGAVVLYKPLKPDDVAAALRQLDALIQT